MIEITSKTAVFHFNKRHLQDPTIPMWVLKAKGESYYVNHVTCNVPWSTKETPDNEHTKGSLKFFNVHILINDENNAIINELTPENKASADKYKKDPDRFICENGSYMGHIKTWLEANNISKKTVYIRTNCSTPKFIIQLHKKHQTFFLLKFGSYVRKLMHNEKYYQVMDDSKYIDQTKDEFDITINDADYNFLEYEYN